MPLANPARRISSALSVVFLAAVSLVGCKDDKKTTPPPSPSDYLEPSSPANVLANLRTAWLERNYDEYAKLLSDDFVFVFNPSDVADPDFPTPQQWFRREELESAKCLFASERIELIDVSWIPEAAEPANDVVSGSWRVRVDQIRLSIRTLSEPDEFWIYESLSAHQDFYFREDPSVQLPGGKHIWHCIRWDETPPNKALLPARGTHQGRSPYTWGQIKVYCDQWVGGR